MVAVGKLAPYLTAAFSSIPRLINDEFLVVAVPQRTVIQNTKLGALLRCMQVAMVIGVAYRLFTQQVWLSTSTPTPFAPLLYTEGGDPGAVQNDNVAHCKDTNSYWFKYDEYWGFYPQHCEALEPGEVSVQRGSEHLFFPTYIMDTTVVKGTSGPCGRATREWCNGTKGVLEDSSSGCSCSSGNEFFVKNPEQQRLGLFHGYEVDTSGGMGTWVIRGKSESPFVWKGPRHDMSEHEETMMTMILSQDGSPCELDGRSRWRYEHAQWGIEGTLGEWMACAGVTLDTNPSTLSKANGLPKHLRTMGVELRLTFDYRNKHDLGNEGVVCYVTVNALAQWSQLQPPPDTIWIGHGGQTAKRMRLAFGVTINTEVTGAFKTFSMSHFILYLVETVIVFKLPLVVTQMIAMYFMGALSGIYRRARQTKFNIYTHYRECIAKLVQAEVAFRSLVGGIWRGPVSDKELHMRHLYLHLRDAFDYHMKNGLLSKDELRHMTSAIFGYMDYEGDGSIGCSDYVRSVSDTSIIDLTAVVKILNETASGKDGGIMKKLSEQLPPSDHGHGFDAPSQKRPEEDWNWEDEELDKDPLDAARPCASSIMPAPAPAWDSSSPAFAALRDAFQRIEALENLRTGQRLLALEETAIASQQAMGARPEPGTSPRTCSTPASAQAARPEAPPPLDVLPRIVELERCVAQLGETLDRRIIELQAKLFPPKIQSADNSRSEGGKLRQVVPSWNLPSSSSADETPRGSMDRYERPRWGTSSMPPLMAAVDQVMQAIPGRMNSRRCVSPGAGEAGGVTPDRSRESPPGQREQRNSRSGEHAGVRPPQSPSPSVERHRLSRSRSCDENKGEGSSCAARTGSATAPARDAQYRMESRIPILGFGESIPIELWDMKDTASYDAIRSTSASEWSQQ